MTQIMTFILAGGSGTRLAPLSLTSPGKLPKQFLSLVGQTTMLQQTAERLPANTPTVVVPEVRYLTEVQKQLPQAKVLAEPFGCNTAAAVGLSALYALKETNNPDCVCFFVPADHIMDKAVFQKYFSQATTLADQTNKIITIGITPTRPETGYGYIQVNKSTKEYSAVARFVEKPDQATAQKYLAEGDYYWNAGIFAMKVKVILEALAKDAPFINEHLLKIDFAKDLASEITREYTAIKSQKQNISIDYAVMEKEAANLLLIPASADLKWNDVGGWEALAEYYPSDKNNNLIINYLNLDINLTNCQDLLIVTSANGILITPRAQAQRAKEIIPGIEAKKKSEVIDSKNTEIQNTSDLYIGVIKLDNKVIKFDGKNLVI